MRYVPTESRHSSWEKLRQTGRDDGTSSRKNLVAAALVCLHHPVKNASKLKKFFVSPTQPPICESFLRSNLLTGPDLLNILIGNVVKFSEKQNAILADIEEMFMQSGMQNDDQSALRFLWTIDNDLRQFLIKPLRDFPKEPEFFTQRKMLGLVSSIFDPIVVLGPLTKNSKLFPSNFKS